MALKRGMKGKSKEFAENGDEIDFKT